MKQIADTTIEVVDLCKNYADIKAAQKLNFKAKSGQIIALLGPNGAGKSTLMNMLAGYLAPSSGKITVLGKDIAQHPLTAKENIGFLSEGSPLYHDMKVRTFLQYMAQLRGLNGSAVKKAADTAHINEVMEQKIETLSKGYQRRVGFAQSILSNPQILLLDEPTDGLDPNQKDYMRGLIKKMSAQKTILISTHLLDEAETVCNRIIILCRGKIMIDGTLKQILQKTGTKSLAEAFRQLTLGEQE